jgi:Ca2+-dependent lipid-binding protein
MKSKTNKRGTNPDWNNEKLHLSWNRKGDASLKLSVFNNDSNKSSGHCDVELENYLDGFHSRGKLSFNYSLQNASRGTIQFDIEFINLK